MSPEHAFQSLITKILEAERRGQPIEREVLIEQYPEHATALRDFFAGREHPTAEYSQTLPLVKTDETSRTEVQDQKEASRTEVQDQKEASRTEVQDQDQTSAEATLSLGATPGNTPVLRSGSAGSPSPAASVVDAAGAVRIFGDYELLEEIARGGMGVVFKARQVSLNRIVALKMILAGQFAGETDVLRFQTEAESAAQLDHPGIVPIFEIGRHQDQHYFSMGYVEGQSLAERVSDGPLPPREAAELLLKISEAMAYAHGRGVIHRDLKPANVLMDASGQPKVTDFGLAKKTEADSDLTGTGQILGTPAYMPPEQAGGKVNEVGPLADVYSLGAILYCLLTGRPPFQAANPMDALRQVLDRDPIPARQLVPTIPRDLETICGKCLSKDPAKRYASAAELAADLQRHLDDQPILARPAGRIERASKWASKQPAIAAILLTMPAWLLGEPKIGVGLLALVAGFHLPFRIRHVRLIAVFVVAIMAAATIGGISYVFVQSDDESGGRIARLAAISLLSLSAPLGIALFVFILDCLSELQQPYRRKAKWILVLSAAASLLCIGGFFYYLSSHSEQVSAIVDQLADEIQSLTTSSQTAVAEEVESSDAMIQLLRSRTVLWIPVITAIIWMYLVLGIITARLIRRFVFVRDATNMESGHSRLQMVKTVDGDVSRWVAITAAVAVAILPYAIGRLLGIYDIQLMRAFEFGNPFDSVIWIAVGAWLAASAVMSRRRLLIASAIGTCLMLFLSYRTVGALETNRQRLDADVTTATATAIPTDESLLLTLKGHTGPVKIVDVAPDGKLAASASGWPKGDGSVRVWDLESGKPLWSRHPGPKQMMAVAFTQDGKRLVGAGLNGMIFIWEAESAREIARFQAGVNLEGLHLFAEDTRCVIAGAKVQLWNLDTLELIHEYQGTDARQLDVSVSGDAKLVATGGMDDAVHIWEIESGNEVAHITDFDWMVESVALNADGSRILVALNGAKNPLLVSLSVDDPSDRVVLSGHESTVNWVRYSDDERFILSASRDKTIRVWDAETGSEIKTLRGHQNWVWSAVLTPDHQNLLSAGGGESTETTGTDFSLRLWDTSRILSAPGE